MINNELTGLKSGLGADFDKKEDTPTISDVTDKAIDPSKDVNNEVPNQKLSSHVSDHSQSDNAVSGAEGGVNEEERPANKDDALPQSAENANEEPKSSVEEEAANSQTPVSDQNQSGSAVLGTEEGVNEEEKPSNKEDVLPQGVENTDEESKDGVEGEALNSQAHISDSQSDSVVSGAEEDFGTIEEHSDEDGALLRNAENVNEEQKNDVKEKASNNQAHISDSQSDSAVFGAKEGANEEEESSNEDGALLRNAENANEEPTNRLSRETSDHISSRQSQSSSSSSEEDFSDSEEEEVCSFDSKDDWTVAINRRADADVALAKELMQKIANTVIPFVGCMMKYCIIMPVVEITIGGIECCKIIVNTTQKVAEYIKNGTMKAFDATKSFVTNHQVAVLTSLCVIAITVPAVYLAVTHGYIASMGKYISNFGKCMCNSAM